jgi:Spy/CpxP family protein refolding chaperone
MALTLLLGTTLGPAAAGFEQPRPAGSLKWWQNEAVQSRVGLTPAQVAEIERIFQSVRSELLAEKAELERQEAALSKRLASQDPDEAGVVRAIDRVEAARSALAKTRTLMLYRMHQQLTREQRARLEAFEREQRQGAEAATRQPPGA